MSPRYNLVILHVPEKQRLSDFLTVRELMAIRAPDIQVHIGSLATKLPFDFWSKAALLPSLIFSPVAVRIDHPGVRIRGARLISVPLTKLEEAHLLSNAGATVPETRVIMTDMQIDETEWGPFTVVKPNLGKQGRGVRLVRTKDLHLWSNTTILPKDDPCHGQTLLAQRYIDTGPFVTSYRVMTVLGRPIYSIVSKAIDKRPKLTISEEIEMKVAANSINRNVTLNYDTEVIDLARVIHSNLPQLPVMGIDIIRDAATGQLYALEFNSGGRFWHISSDYGLAQQRKYGLDFNKQFNALGTITDALIEATRKLAV